jgi:small conductance mechanosensitive channel
MQDLWDKASAYILQYGMNFIAALLIFFIGRWVAQFIGKFLQQSMEKAKVNPTLASFTKNVVYYGILVFVAIASLNKLGVETNSFVAVIGAAGLAVGLALQGSLANFAAGVMIVLFQPFQVGDRIEAGGAIGRVQEIQIFSTIIMSDDKTKIIVPNAKVTADKIVIHGQS